MKKQLPSEVVLIFTIHFSSLNICKQLSPNLVPILFPLIIHMKLHDNSKERTTQKKNEHKPNCNARGKCWTYSVCDQKNENYNLTNKTPWKITSPFYSKQTKKKMFIIVIGSPTSSSMAMPLQIKNWSTHLPSKIPHNSGTDETFYLVLATNNNQRVPRGS